MQHLRTATATCLKFGLAAIVVLVVSPMAVAQTVITTGVDTHLWGDASESSLPHGTDPSPNNGLRWDTDSSGSPRQGLLWFDIPAATLAAFNATPGAIARINYTQDPSDPGDDANLHRATADWLSGPNGGNNVTWDNMPGGPGLILGTNVENTFNASTSGHSNAATPKSVLVTTDVAAWAAGTPNYGWGVVPVTSSGTKTLGFEEANPADRPTLTLATLVSPASSPEIISKNSSWSYFEDIDTTVGGATADAYPVDGSGSDAWFAVNHDEGTPNFGTWKTGNGAFADGGVSVPEVTTLDIQQSPGVNRPTFLFRKDFTLTAIEAANAESIDLELLTDDGGAIYINETLVFESGMPGNITTPGWDHSTYTGGTGSENYVSQTIDLSLFPGLLASGSNLIAVELHNGSSSSSDVGFDLELTLQIPEILGDLNTAAASASTPEPSAAALALLAMLGLFAFFWRRHPALSARSQTARSAAKN